MKKQFTLIIICLTCLIPKAQNISPAKYRAEIVCGSFLFCSGVSLMGFTIFADNYKALTETFPLIKKPGIALGFSLGSAATVTGAILLGVGLNERSIYNDRKRSVSIICSDKIGIAYRF